MSAKGIIARRGSTVAAKGVEGDIALLAGSMSDRPSVSRLGTGAVQGLGYEIKDLGGGFYRVRVGGGEIRVVRDDASMLAFAREANLHLQYK